LLRPGDRVTWRRVTEAELEAAREALAADRAEYDIVDEPFDVRAYLGFLRKVDAEATAFRQRQEAAQKVVPVP
jgi:hypothetical protein